MKFKIALVIAILVLVIGGWALKSRGEEKPSEVEFRYSPVATGE